MKSIFTKEDIDFIKQNYSSLTYKEIGNKLGFTERQIRGKANNMGLTKLRTFNKHYFHKIDTSNKAYYVGLLFADGWIINNPKARTYECSIELQSQDRYIY